jgi:hypothetical protein
MLTQYQQQPNFEQNRHKTQETTTEITDRHRAGDMMGKTNQGKSIETDCTRKTTRYLHNEQNVNSNYKKEH